VIGRIGGNGARGRSHEHHGALERLSKVHAIVTALRKTGVKRRIEAEQHNGALGLPASDYIRITGFPFTLSKSSLRSAIFRSIRPFPDPAAFTLREWFRFEMSSLGTQVPPSLSS
jgi:hypothetical protein